MDAVAAANAGRELVFARLLRDGIAELSAHPAIRMSALCTICTANAVSMMSLLVRPKWNQRLAWSWIFSATAVVKPMTSWLRVFSSSFWRATRPGKSANHLSAPRFDFGEIGARHDAFLDQRFAGEQFDLKPEPELVFVGPDGPHFRSGIARNHAMSLKRRGSRVESRVPEKKLSSLDPRLSTIQSCTSRRMASYITAPIRAGRAASGLAKGTAPSRPRVISLVPAFSQFALNGSVYTL